MQVTDEMAEIAARILNKRLAEGNLFGVSREMLEAALAAAPAGAEPVAWTSQKQLDQLRDVHGTIVDMWNKGLLPPEKEIPLFAASSPLTEKESSSIPNGWMLVPIAPTERMAEQAAIAHYGRRRVDLSGGVRGITMTVNSVNYNFLQAFRRFWRGALAAAPTPKAEGEQ